MLIEYHNGVSIALYLVPSQSASGLTFEWETGVGEFGWAARLKSGAGGGSAAKLDVYRIYPYFGTSRQGFEGAASFESVPSIVVIVDYYNAFHSPVEIAMTSRIGQVHVGGQVEVDVYVYGPCGDLFGYAISIVTTVKKG